MKLLLEASELASYIKKLSDWYNKAALYVLSNMPEISRRVDFIDDPRSSAVEAYNKLWKRYESEHPKPSWKDLLPD